MTEEVKNNRKLIPLELNAGQRIAYSEMRDFLEGHDDRMFLLEGSAGSGKTYCLAKLIKYISEVHPSWRIAMTGPTNKSVKVLSKSASIKGHRVVFQTIHKLLGLTEEITSSGQQIFTRKFGSKPEIEDYHIVIVDESSMLHDDLFKELQEHCGHIRILFMGDPAQIPPVGKLDAIPFKENERNKYGIDICRLTEIMRQAADNPIIRVGIDIREDLGNPSSSPIRESILNDNGHGVDFIEFSRQEERDRLMVLFEELFTSKEFVLNSDHAKVIAWRNITVDKMNNIIRSIIYKDTLVEQGTLPKIMVGEKLLANKPISDRYNIIIFNTNDEFEVLSYEIKERRFAFGDDAYILKYYSTKVQYTDINSNKQVRTIDILHEESEENSDKVLKNLKADALSKSGFEAKKCWVKYYEFMRQFADVAYDLCLTSHKAQGSTYRNVFVIEDDINRNSNVVERNRIKYTAMTRPTDKLFIVKQ